VRFHAANRLDDLRYALLNAPPSVPIGPSTDRNRLASAVSASIPVPVTARLETMVRLCHARASARKAISRY
jgi:hypothetical protein